MINTIVNFTGIGMDHPYAIVNIVIMIFLLVTAIRAVFQIVKWFSGFNV